MRKDHVLRGHASVKEHFQVTATTPEIHKKAKPAPPFSIRFSEEERAYLNREAGSRPLAAYIRDKLFGDAKFSNRNFRRPTKKSRQPSVDHRALAEALGGLGQSRLASNMNQIAKAANVGTLPVTQELEQDLHDACAAIYEMRQMLITALGIKSEDA